MARSRLLAVLAAVSLGPGGLAADADRGFIRAREATRECLRFEPPDPLTAGTPFCTHLMRGLEFRLSSDWQISIGPIDEPSTDYLWVVSPPLRTAPHRMIGAGYGMTARESTQIERPLRFVLTRADYDAALAALELTSAADTLERLEQLGVGHLSLVDRT